MAAIAAAAAFSAASRPIDLFRRELLLLLLPLSVVGPDADAEADVIHIPEAYLTGFLMCTFVCLFEGEASSCSSCAASFSRPDNGCDDDDDSVDNLDDAINCCCCMSTWGLLGLEASWAAHVLHGQEAMTSSRKQSKVDCF